MDDGGYSYQKWRYMKIQQTYKNENMLFSVLEIYGFSLRKWMHIYIYICIYIHNIYIYIRHTSQKNGMSDSFTLLILAESWEWIYCSSSPPKRWPMVTLVTGVAWRSGPGLFIFRTLRTFPIWQELLQSWVPGVQFHGQERITIDYNQRTKTLKGSKGDLVSAGKTIFSAI